MTKSRNKKLPPRKNKSRLRPAGRAKATAARPQPPNRPPRETIVRWRPAWHGLDRSLAVGEQSEFCLVPVAADAPRPPGAAPPVAWEFSRGLTAGTPPGAVTRTGTIARIEHAELGALQSVETAGLDYHFSLAQGTQYVVNAEESPGESREVAVRCWDLRVTLVD